MVEYVVGRTPSVAREAPPGENRVLIHGVPWKTYAAMRELLDTPGLRMTYCEGALEIMTPSPLHELRKKTIARLLEVYSLVRGAKLVGYGSTTFRREARQRGLEPDECYVIGGPLEEAPDIALEVVVTSGGLDKLPVYAGLEVREVWLFEHGAFQLWGLRGAAYAQLERGSELLPELDLDELARFAVRDDQDAAVREYYELLRRI